MPEFDKSLYYVHSVIMIKVSSVNLPIPLVLKAIVRIFKSKEGYEKKTTRK